MSYYLQGLGAAFPPSGMNVANTSIANSAMTTMATVYRDPQMSYRPITCSPGTVLDASGTGCVSPLRCSGGSLLNIKTGQCVFPNKAAPIDFTAVRKLTYAKPVMTDLGPVDKVAACAAQGGVLSQATGLCVTGVDAAMGEKVAQCAAQGGVLNMNGDCVKIDPAVAAACAAKFPGGGHIDPTGACSPNSATDLPEFATPDHTMLYVGLGVAALAAIAIGVVMMKKRKSEP